MAGGTKSAPGPLTREIAALLHDKMARKGVNDLALSNAIGADRISRPQVQKIRKGLKRVDVEDLERMCWALGVDFLDLLKQADDATSTRHIDPEWDVKPL